MSDLLGDLRRSSRILFRSPGLSALAVLAFGLGIGLTTMMFSIVYGAMLRGLPFEDGDQIVSLSYTNPSEGINRTGVSIHDFHEWDAAQQSMTHLAAYYTGTVNITGSDRPERFDGAFMTAGAFELLGAAPVHGRTWRADEDVPDAPLTVLLGHHVWRDHHGSDPAVVGRTLRVNGETATVIGIMPEDFRFPDRQDLWLPLRMDPLSTPRSGGMLLSVIGRMGPGVDTDRVHLDITSISARLATAFPDTNEGLVPRVGTFTEENLGDEAGTLLLTMLVAVSFVLLIACFNVANLLLARAAVRSREVAIRTALGSPRSRIIREQLLESVTLAMVGAALGLGIASAGLRLFSNAIEPTNPPSWIRIDLNPAVLLFAVAMASLAAVVAGLIPALQASGARVHDLLKDESRGGTSLRLGRLSRGLVIGEVALSVALLAGAGLMIRSIVNVGNLDLGFVPEEIFSARMGLFETDFPTPEDRVAFWMQVDERIRGLPGVEASGLTTALPATGGGVVPVMIQGEPYATDRDVPRSRTLAISPGYEEVIGLPLLEGRTFGSADDGEGMPVALVTRLFAERFFPGGSPVGRQIRLGPPSNADAVWLTVVGVLGDSFHTTDDAMPWAVYTPIAQGDARFMSVAVRTRGEPMALTGDARAAVMGVNADTPLYFVRNMAEVIHQQTWFYQVFGVLFAVFGAAALFLAAVGLYGVLAFSVGRRTPELGIRMALGAGAGDVRRLVLRQGFLQIGVGLVVGLGMAVLLGRALGNFLFEVDPRDPLVFLGTAAVLLLTGMAASAIPVRRATRVDPMVAFRA